MARVVRMFKTFKTHWKKTTVGVCLLTWGGSWLYGKHCDNLLRRAACQEAQVFGNQLIPSNMQVKKATVFLNPAACKGKARNLFEKNAAPILHLSGLDITIVKATFSKIPIGFIPLGKTSTLSQTLYPGSLNQVQRIADATLAILKGETIPLDVLQIKGEKEQPVFAVTGLRWGSYRDAGVKVSKYWYLGPLKTKAAHFFNTLKEWPQKHQASLTYLGPTKRPPEEPEEKPSRPSLYVRIYRRLSLYWASPQKEIPHEVTLEAWEEMQLSTIELSITTQNRQLDLTGTEGSFGIDSEEYEAMPVEVKLLPRKLEFFCDPRRREQMLQPAVQ
ncbi:Acylglycerol kinase [Chelonia mydas]|uniref:Acylglycerol kinase, mitochondrial n=1 Tax=Chelonia mydas TaxID=8469 RepID=M7AGH5_CHEMY|nr:Acylglycerol kinase [Chelonia mydas]